MEYTVIDKEHIDNIYNIFISNPDESHMMQIDKSKHEIDNIFSAYENMMGSENRKKTGSFYTEKSIVKFMLTSSFDEIDIVNNPYIKILDPSCGCGYFLAEAYCILKESFTKNIDAINKKYSDLNLTEDNIHEHIIKYNIYGSDLDSNAAKMAIINLMSKKLESRVIPNIICCDSIINCENTLFEKREFWAMDFDIIVGNPPYIGHKKVSGSYRKQLNEIYGDIFKDKADISFCFIKSSIDRLKDNGKLCFITSRYFLESPSGRHLREYIKQKCNIDTIIDFYGVRIMKGISVDPVIIFLTKSSKKPCNDTKVIKAEPTLKNIKTDDVFINLKRQDNKYFKFFYINSGVLKSDGWSLCCDEDMSIIKKIEDTLKLRLSDICLSFQGIITGCDKAFIVNETIIEKYGIEREVIKKWIKNSNINKYRVDESSLFIIYSDLIDNTEIYKGAVSYIYQFKDRLEKRRECVKNVRKWFELQWGRNRELFEKTKIIFPYKSSSNRFAIDKGHYNSADIYGMAIKESSKDKISYEFLLGLLNSSLYEFYFKSFGKKLGDNLYDYYPNTVMRLMIPEYDNKYIADTVRCILCSNDKLETEKYINDIDNCVYNMFGLSDKEIELIKRRVMP